MSSYSVQSCHREERTAFFSLLDSGIVLEQSVAVEL